MTINLISTDNGVGLTQDSNILKAIFEANGCTVRVLEFKALRKSKPTKADVNIFLELFDGRMCNAKRNYLIPNQEWFLLDWIPGLAKLDAVLCKTRHAEKLFSHHCKTEYISFTSRDMGYSKEKQNRFVHLRGRSSTKGTLQILQAWKDNQDLPELLIHMTRDYNKLERQKITERGLKNLPNVKYSKERLPEDKYNALAKDSAFHVCTSPCEGFGHYINEPMSAGCFVITTDAPPMDELVIDGTSGMLVDYSHTATHHLGRSYFAKPKHIAIAARYAMMMTDEARQKIGRNARKAYEKRDKYFRKRIKRIILNE